MLLVEVEERQGIARLFDVPPLPYEERKVAIATGGGEVRALCIAKYSSRAASTSMHNAPDLAPAGRDGHLAFLVGQWRDVEQPGDALPLLDLDQQYPAAVRGQRQCQRGGNSCLAVPPFPVMTCKRARRQSAVQADASASGCDGSAVAWRCGAAVIAARRRRW